MRLTYANVMATLAFFVAIGGTTIAATKINGGQIKKATVRGKALKPDTLAGREIREEGLGEVPSAANAGEAATAGVAANAATLGGLTPAQLTDDCPQGTQPYAGACFETAFRTSATWPSASKACGDAGRRLPTLSELEGFRQQPGIVLGNPEHSSSFQDGDGAPLDSDGYVVVTMNDSGTISTAYDHDQSFALFRCVAPATNR